MLHYRIWEDGSFDLLGGHISLSGCYPCLDGEGVRPLKIRIRDPEIVYELTRGRLILTLRQEEGRLRLSCRTEGIQAGLHSLEPCGHAQILGALQMYQQGPGMEGPSGMKDLTRESALSYGLTALCGQEHILLAYALDHTRFTTAFRAGSRQSLFEEKLVFGGGFDLEGTLSPDDVLPDLYFDEQTGLQEGLRVCAGRIADHMHARNSMPPVLFWCSWYYLYETLDQTLLHQYLKGMQDAPGIPFQYVEIDAGYAPSLGDWLDRSPRYPGGLKEAARAILDAGYKPGIWIGPFMVGDQSRLYAEHPDWILHDREGRPLVQLTSYTEPKLWGNRDSNYYVLDVSHPQAFAWLRTVFETLRSWGFVFFKTDFMLWNMHDTSEVLRYDPTLTSVQLLRRTLQMIREVIGQDSYLLGCIAPFMPFIGYADGMRIASDGGARWAEPFGPVNLLQELPCDNYFNHIFWQNDPDSVLLRDFDTHLTREEIRTLALIQAVSGGAISTSDPVHLLGRDQKALFEMILPDGRHTPSLPGMRGAGKELLFTHRLEQGNLLFAMNPTQEPIRVCWRLSELFGEKQWYQYLFQWDEDQAATPRSVQDDLLMQILPPHGSVLAFVTERPLTKRPSNLWNW